MENSDNSNDSQEELFSYAITIGENLHKRIDNHLHLLKNLGKENCTKQKWLLEALTEKLKKNTSTSDIPKAKHLRIQINKNINKQLQDMVEYIKNFRRSYSKKQLIMEAIYDKLDQEEDRSKSLLLKLKDIEKKFS